MEEIKSDIISNQITNIKEKLLVIKAYFADESLVNKTWVNEKISSLDFDCQVLDWLLESWPCRGRHYREDVNNIRREKRKIINFTS